MAKYITATDQNFDETVLGSDVPVLVDFWAPWCGPCRAIAPLIEQLADEYEGKAAVAKVNVDDNFEISSRYGIRSIPTLLIFKDGKPVDQLIGMVPKKMLAERLDKFVVA